MASLPPHNLHTQSPRVDQFRDVCDHHSSYSHDVCSYCQSFNHDMISCPYYDISDESYGRLNAMIETINYQHTHFVSEMRECGLLHEIALGYLSLSFRLVFMMNVSLSLPLNLMLLMMHLRLT